MYSWFQTHLLSAKNVTMKLPIFHPNWYVELIASFHCMALLNRLVIGTLINAGCWSGKADCRVQVYIVAHDQPCGACLICMNVDLYLLVPVKSDWLRTRSDVLHHHCWGCIDDCFSFVPTQANLTTIWSSVSYKVSISQMLPYMNKASLRVLSKLAYGNPYYLVTLHFPPLSITLPKDTD